MATYKSNFAPEMATRKSCHQKVSRSMASYVMFAPPLVVPFQGSSAKALERHSRFPSTAAKKPKAKSRILLMSGGNKNGKSLPEFDRDYYDELKAEFGHLSGVSIFSKDDYQLDPLDIPWIFENRARNLDHIRHDLNTTPVSDGELTDVPDRPMRVSDVHSKEEIDAFRTGFRDGDAVSGRKWDDPMPESDFDRDPRWIHLRKINDDELKASQEEPELWFDGMEKPALRRQQYGSEEEEIEALNASFGRMQAELFDIPFEPAAYGESNAVPNPEDFRSWKQEAENRGGNATEYESYALSPFSSWDPKHVGTEGADEVDAQPPRQHHTLVQEHVGQWEGQVAVIYVNSGDRFSPQIQDTFSSSSEVYQSANGSLEWVTALDCGGEELVSSVVFSNPDSRDALIPGRAVSENGSYVCKGGCSSQNPISACSLSLSETVVKRIARYPTCSPVMEICVMTEEATKKFRHRVVLCSGSVALEGRNEKREERVNTILVISEVIGSAPLSMNTRFPEAAMDGLLGTWHGNALLLQPEYPPMSCRSLKTKRSVIIKKDITEDDVTFVENRIPEHPDRESKRRVRALGKKKVSKRVAASKAHDRRRLSACSLLFTQTTGDNEAETFGWQLTPNPQAFSCMYSPRVGRFVDDYCGILVAKSLLLTFPFNRATPNMWNEVSITELTSPSRKRITVGRNESGDIVGVLFVSERVEDSSEGDSVAAYV